MKYLAIVGMLLLASIAAGQEEESAFYVDPSLVQSVYKQSRAEVHNHPEQWTVAAEFGAMDTAPLLVESDLYAVDYAANRDYLPTGAISVEQEIWQSASLAGEVALQAGYTSYRDTVEAISADGIEVEDNLVLQVIPLRLRHALRAKALTTESISPKLLVEAGQTWLHQSGTLDGMEASSWQGSVGAGLGADLFADPEAGFGGISVTSVVSRRKGRPSGWTHLIGSRLVL